jgi:glyoxylase-like metal-dependent hydrolase (beta-lactamase superfamily II)
MHVQRVEVTIAPGFIENCYLLSDAPGSRQVVVVDPGAQAERILAAVGGRSIERIILTHRHYDHTGALSGLLEKAPVEVVAHRLEAASIPDLDSLPGFLMRPSPQERPVTRTVEDGELVAVGAGQVRVLHTPGHTVGSMCLYDEEGRILIAGDTLFYGAVGRTDFPTGDAEQQRESLGRLAMLPDDTTVHPGHDEDTSIGQERRRGILGPLGRQLAF